eukprot:CAMPEP_0114981198 /NCGR_PEP_ID=MMETSP0216-20121206/5405_1 /TAXON_ID=223996 /ORGANISM="Protocruzia adherens, Strain Boccale" /LENGTH=263 /DNA_ID=CAMNT_0002342831 /DNA_START=97 /DNA_END=884 /DNA_ORIENTATION=-
MIVAQSNEIVYFDSKSGQKLDISDDGLSFMEVADSWNSNTPNEQKIITCDTKGKLRIHDFDSKKEEALLDVETEVEDCFIQSSEQKMVILNENAILIYDLPSRSRAEFILNTKITTEREVLDVLVREERIYGTSGKWMLIWSLHNGRLLHSQRLHQAPICSVCFAKDGDLLITAGKDKKVKVWNTDTLTEAVRLRGHSNPVLSVNSSHNEKFVISGEQGGIFSIWDISSGMLERMVTTRDVLTGDFTSMTVSLSRCRSQLAVS